MTAETRVSPGRAAYLDRSCSPTETVKRLRPHFAALGITRLAKQTGLDTIGIPCYSAFRPNAKSLAVSQGKGIDDHAAMASAAMEAAELAIAERALPSVWRGSVLTLNTIGARWYDPRRLMPMGWQLDQEISFDWIFGRGLVSGLSYLVPLDAVRLDGRAGDLPGICQHTNGLASGNTEQEAVFHACCELIERDAATLWSIRPTNFHHQRAFDPLQLEDAEIDSLVASIRAAKLDLHVFDITSDLGIPTVRAIIGSSKSWRHFDVAEGTGTHPVTERATIRAITEAAQSRLTAIAGSRDDIDPLDYNAPQPSLDMPAHQAGAPPIGLALGTSLHLAMVSVLDAFTSRLSSEPVIVTLGGESFGISVVRALSVELEDREANANWRPGARTVAALMEMQS